MSWDNRIREYHAPFDIIVTVRPEFVPIADLFDDSIDPDTGKKYYDVDYMRLDPPCMVAHFLQKIMI